MHITLLSAGLILVPRSISLLIIIVSVCLFPQFDLIAVISNPTSHRRDLASALSLISNALTLSTVIHRVSVALPGSYRDSHAQYLAARPRPSLKSLYHHLSSHPSAGHHSSFHRSSSFSYRLLVGPLQIEHWTRLAVRHPCHYSTQVCRQSFGFLAHPNQPVSYRHTYHRTLHPPVTCQVLFPPPASPITPRFHRLIPSIKSDFDHLD
ncbi:hypothetical protein O181_022318 [Austropuccinia psidii MF-1]|uniref:Uncharacterized protein n=1 Tax=Austropuccinia psidii MF-1 TaxID=1389203 RepID=A0A9Q3GW82_9BASI|nr:hypothetical protein [Austropuccinia psidii MF-1]